MSLKRKFVSRREREAKLEVKRAVKELTSQSSAANFSSNLVPIKASTLQNSQPPVQGQPQGLQSGSAATKQNQDLDPKEPATSAVFASPSKSVPQDQKSPPELGEVPSWRQEPGSPHSPVANEQSPASSITQTAGTYIKDRSQLNERDYRIISRDFDLTGAPNPLRAWSDTDISVSSIYKAPTAIQAGAIPLILQGNDVVGIAPTGSGKTLAFVLPASKQQLTLVLSPTRELAIQTSKVFEANGISACALIGGHSAQEQRQQLLHTKAIIATPGRLVDFMDNENLDLCGVTFFVLDEADRMLDMGFEDALVRVKSATGQVQTAMFTATWDENVQAVAQQLLQAPFTLKVGATLNSRISQTFEWTTPDSKLGTALKALKRLPAPCLVFCNTKAACDALGLPAVHSGRPQAEREHTLRLFARHDIPAICATDVIGRGIDIAVRSVLNYDMPTATDTFVHRVGRTGRAGKTGVAHTLLEDKDKSTLIELKKLIRHAGISAAGLDRIEETSQD